MSISLLLGVLLALDADVHVEDLQDPAAHQSGDALLDQALAAIDQVADQLDQVVAADQAEEPDVLAAASDFVQQAQRHVATEGLGRLWTATHGQSARDGFR